MQSSLLNSTLEDKNLSEIPNFRQVSCAFSASPVDFSSPLFGYFSNNFLYYLRLLLKQLVTMEVIQWVGLWNMFKDEFENEKNMLGGSLGGKAAEDLRQRIIEHVVFLFIFSFMQ